MSDLKQIRYVYGQQAQSKELQDKNMTYIVIVNKTTGQETKAQIPTAVLMKDPKMICHRKDSNVFTEVPATEKRMPQLELKAKTKSVIRSRGLMDGADVKMNFSTQGFDDYDSSMTSNLVFKDDDENEVTATITNYGDEGFSEMKSSYQTSVNDCEDDPLSHLSSPIPGSSATVLATKNITPANSTDMSGCSGYFSDGSPYFSQNYNTPSPATLNPKHAAARKVFFISPDGQNSNHSNSESQVNSHGSVSSPVTSLASNLKNVAFFHSPSPIPSDMTNVHRLREQTLCAGSSPSLSGIPKPTTTAKLMQIQSSTPKLMTIQSVPSKSATPLPPNTTSIQSMNIKLPLMSQVPKSKTIVVQKKSNSDPSSSHGDARPLGHSVEKVDDVVLHFNVSNKETVVQVTSAASDSEELTCSQDSQSSNQSEKDLLNNSLTNMHWLEGMQGINDPEKCKEESKAITVTNPSQWRYLSATDVAKIAKECGKSKRPPFSYMTLIQMALHSREDKRMTLREICKWIEDTFPFYKFTAKPGWKNSIRHNLSLYSIFEREKTKKHGSYWTVRDDCPEKSKSLPVKDRKVISPGMASMVQFMPSFLHPSHGLKLPLPQNPHNTAKPTIPVVGDGKKKGPQPILPRPLPYSNTPMQTYALIPIQSLSGQGVAQPANFLPIQENKTAVNLFPKEKVNSQKPEKDHQGGKHRYSNIAPKANLSGDNILRQAWLNSQSSDTEMDKSFISGRSDTENVTEDVNCDSVGATKKAKLKAGLPMPKIYLNRTPPTRKTKTRRKQKLVPKERDLMQDSSDEEASKFIQGLEKGIGPDLEENNGPGEEETVITSTPFKKSNFSPNMTSPILGFTPLKGSNLLDNSFLDCLKDCDSDVGGKGFIISPDVLSRKKLMSPGQHKNLNLSQLGNFSFNLTPIKTEGGTDVGEYNQSLSKFLAEFPIDSHMMEDGDGLPVDLSNLSWSNVGHDPSNFAENS